MTDLEDFENEINSQLEGLQKDIENISKKEASQKPQAITKCQQKVKQIQSWIETFELEITTSGNNRKYNESLKNIKTRLEKLKVELEDKKQEGSNSLYSHRSKNKDPNDMTSDELIQLGDTTQGKSKDALGRIINRVNEGNQILDNVSAALGDQEEQLMRINQSLKDTQSLLKRSEELLQYFGKQVMTDKLIMGLIFLVVSGILVIVILKLVGADGSKKSEDQFRS